jgi:hypothetical protein
MRRFLGLLAGHLLSAFVGGLVLAALLRQDPFWQGLSGLELLGLAAGLSVSVAALSAPGWALLRLGVIRPLLRRGMRGVAVPLLFVACQTVNALASLLGMVAWNGGYLAADARGSAIVLLLFAASGAAGGAAAWVGETLVAGQGMIGRAAA